MAKSSSGRSSRASRSSYTNKVINNRRHQPLSPPGGFSGRRSRYEQGGEIDW